jgi:PAS domain S-box-containing protein
MAEARRTEATEPHDADRTVAQLDMLHSLGAKLNALADEQEIGAAITAELRTIIDYHNCRVYVLQEDGRTLLPIAFRGEMLFDFPEYADETLDELVTEVGEGITGHVAATRESLLTPDAREVEFSVTIPGTDDDLLESMLAVAMVAGDDLVGVIVLSSLGYGMFDEADQRLLEVLAAHAGVAFQKARLLKAERESAEVSRSLFQLSQALTARRSAGDVFQEALETLPRVIGCAAAGAYVQDAETGWFKLARLHAVGDVRVKPRHEVADVPPEVANAFLASEVEPFVIPQAVAEQVPSELHFMDEFGDVLVTPIRWEPDGFGAITIVAVPGATFGESDLVVARGLGHIASLALGNARRISDLERFHELVGSLDATFWETDASLAFTFLGGRAGGVLGEDAPAWPAQGKRWGDHIATRDRAAALEACKGALGSAEDVSIEYRVVSPDGEVVWIRDLIHVVRGGARPQQIRGLMVDITERKLAEQTLRASEQKYSEAFRREREASQQLRALDEMKNTFLEAVSHDLRTPLTSILGSALTLEQAVGNLEPDDTRDLVRRIAANARKLERLLGDLLDLDRLQRGIVSPQRVPTELGTLVRRAVEETENRHDRPIEIDVEEVTVSVDGPKVERIIENLVSNALRHTDSEVHVWITARGQDGGVFISVDDDGPGIPERLRDEIFEPFRQAPGSAAEHSPGVGVGLSLVRRFAELHGGRAWVEERAGGGSSFKVFLPGG